MLKPDRRLTWKEVMRSLTDRRFKTRDELLEEVPVVAINQPAEQVLRKNFLQAT